uniref:Uncharacterized protein n=1 Tax=viral metagenome TaxID=1070528 RepID=A0A6C0JPR6_9ZZZZ
MDPIVTSYRDLNTKVESEVGKYEYTKLLIFSEFPLATQSYSDYLSIMKIYDKNLFDIFNNGLQSFILKKKKKVEESILQNIILINLVKIKMCFLKKILFKHLKSYFEKRFRIIKRDDIPSVLAKHINILTFDNKNHTLNYYKILKRMLDDDEYNQYIDISIDVFFDDFNKKLLKIVEKYKDEELNFLGDFIDRNHKEKISVDNVSKLLSKTEILESFIIISSLISLDIEEEKRIKNDIINNLVEHIHSPIFINLLIEDIKLSNMLKKNKESEIENVIKILEYEEIRKNIYKDFSNRKRVLSFLNETKNPEKYYKMTTNEFLKWVNTNSDKDKIESLFVEMILENYWITPLFYKYYTIDEKEKNVDELKKYISQPRIHNMIAKENVKKVIKKLSIDNSISYFNMLRLNNLINTIKIYKILQFDNYKYKLDQISSDKETIFLRNTYVKPIEKVSLNSPKILSTTHRISLIDSNIRSIFRNYLRLYFQIRKDNLEDFISVDVPEDVKLEKSSNNYTKMLLEEINKKRNKTLNDINIDSYSYFVKQKIQRITINIDGFCDEKEDEILKKPNVIDSLSIMRNLSEQNPTRLLKKQFTHILDLGEFLEEQIFRLYSETYYMKMFKVNFVLLYSDNSWFSKKTLTFKASRILSFLEDDDYRKIFPEFVSNYEKLEKSVNTYFKENLDSFVSSTKKTGFLSYIGDYGIIKVKKEKEHRQNYTSGKEISKVYDLYDIESENVLKDVYSDKLLKLGEIKDIDDETSMFTNRLINTKELCSFIYEKMVKENVDSEKLIKMLQKNKYYNDLKHIVEYEIEENISLIELLQDEKNINEIIQKLKLNGIDVSYSTNKKELLKRLNEIVRSDLSNETTFLPIDSNYTVEKYDFSPSIPENIHLEDIIDYDYSGTNIQYYFTNSKKNGNKILLYGNSFIKEMFIEGNYIINMFFDESNNTIKYLNDFGLVYEIDTQNESTKNHKLIPQERMLLYYVFKKTVVKLNFKKELFINDKMIANNVIDSDVNDNFLLFVVSSSMFLNVKKYDLLKNVVVETKTLNKNEINIFNFGFDIVFEKNEDKYKKINEKLNDIVKLLNLNEMTSIPTQRAKSEERRAEQTSRSGNPPASISSDMKENLLEQISNFNFSGQLSSYKKIINCIVTNLKPVKTLSEDDYKINVFLNKIRLLFNIKSKIYLRDAQTQYLYDMTSKTLFSENEVFLNVSDFYMGYKCIEMKTESSNHKIEFDDFVFDKNKKEFYYVKPFFNPTFFGNNVAFIIYDEHVEYKTFWKKTIV